MVSDVGDATDFARRQTSGAMKRRLVINGWVADFSRTVDRIERKAPTDTFAIEGRRNVSRRAKVTMPR